MDRPTGLDAHILCIDTLAADWVMAGSSSFVHPDASRRALFVGRESAAGDDGARCDRDRSSSSVGLRRGPGLYGLVFGIWHHNNAAHDHNPRK